jgi:hypothetical protein
MSGLPGARGLLENVTRWVRAVGLDLAGFTLRETWADRFVAASGAAPCRAGADLRSIRGWEERHGFALPRGLRIWLELSDGLYRFGPLIHPLSAIGPMIPFARVPELLVQPESWFELGNPGSETVCIDLGYQWPGGDCPIFSSGDDGRRTAPRIIAPSFEHWLMRLLSEGGREYWLDRGFNALGDPWVEHRRHTPAPPLPERLRSLAARVLPLVRTGADDRAIASSLGISRFDVEAIFRHLQHAAADLARS